MGRVSNKVAIVTGGARGLGAAAVRLLVSEGAKVVITDVLDEDGAALATELGDSARFEHHDVSSGDEWRALIATTEAAFGPVSILVNNAGISALGPIDGYSEDQYRRVIDVNQVGVFLGMQTVLPSMRRAGGGAIINMSSAAGLIGAAYALAYTASKFAVRGMTKVAAIEFGPDKIRVNSVHPGPFRTNMVADPDDPTPGSLHPAIQHFMGSLPAGRVGEPSELAQIILLLASDEMRFATGAEFVIDGGLTCM